MNEKSTAKNAFSLGIICAFSYLAVYISRNVLSAVSPQMISDGIASEKLIGTMSSVFFFSYAIGQLVNGIIGDVIKSKYMITIGLVLAGISSLVIPLVLDSLIFLCLLYGLIGFSLSMIYGPMTKTIAENTEPHHAINCNLALNFSAYFGAPTAGLLALFFTWDNTFKSSGVILIFIAVVCFIIFTFFEAKNIIVYSKNKYSKKDNFISSIEILLKRSIVKFTFVSILTGVIRTTVLFWLPTYLMQHLNFSEKSSTKIFTVTSLLISVGSFIAVYIYKLFRKSIDNTLMFSFIMAAILFIATFIIKQPIINIVSLLLAIIASNCASTMIWSFYCPSLADTGLVSSATGYLDFISYMAAAISSKLFANAVGSIGWDGLILVWFALMFAGIIITIPYKKRCDN